VDAYYLQEAVKAAINTAKEDGKNAVVEIKVEPPQGVTVTKTEVTLPSNGLEDVRSGNVDPLRIATKSATISMSNAAVSKILNEAGSRDVTFVTSSEPALNEEQKNAVGEAPVFEVKVRAGDTPITSFTDAPITIHLPYTLKQGETAKGVEVYRVEDDGNLVAMKTTYDDGMATFQTPHLSLFTIKHTSDNGGDGGGGGCDAGLGFAGILAIAFVGINASRRREK
jgi:hypothetical protein